MRNQFRLFLLLPLGLMLLDSVRADDAPNKPAREHLPADPNWKFHLGDAVDAQSTGFDDAHWRQVDLPHDWSIEGAFDFKSPTGGAEAFLPEGIGWYRHAFTAPARWRGRKVSVDFEGVYMNAQVWLNGAQLGIHPYGYTSFHFDLTPRLKIGAENILAVRVDNSKQKNSRWYSGSGIYRHVWLTVTDPVHIPPWGVFVSTTTISPDSAQIGVATEITNANDVPAAVTLQTTVLGPDGRQIAVAESPASVGGENTIKVEQQIRVPHPSLWSPETPRLYHAVTRVSQGGRIIDEVDTPFGIRTLAWSVDKGLQLNGQSLKLAGGCIHQDNGCLGSACFDRAEERRVELLKAAGFNALRMAHNPPSPELLDACDRLGMLVLDEAFDCWGKGKSAYDYHLYFDDWWQKDIDAMVLRDRNHPSVVMWSIGNEIPQQYEANAPAIGRALADRIRGLDATRPVTEAFCYRPQPAQIAPWDRLCAALDIVGYNYNIDKGRTEDHVRAPSRTMVCTETFPREAFSIWDQVQTNSYITGEFVWTAMDYLGENGIGSWGYGAPKSGGHDRDDFIPWHGAYCGDLDEIGTRKDCSHYRNILWDRGEKLYVTVRQPVKKGEKIWVERWGVDPSLQSWNWPGWENQPMQVDVYSRYSSVQLFQDGKLVGEKPTARDQQFRATFDVNYTPGALKAVGLLDGKPAEEQTIATTGAPAGIRLTADKARIKADGQDLSYIGVEVVDKNGHLVPNADQEIDFRTDGNGTIAGVGNGDMTSMEPYQGSRRKVFQGRALVVIRATHQPGVIHVRAEAQGLASGTVSLESQ